MPIKAKDVEIVMPGHEPLDFVIAPWLLDHSTIDLAFNEDLSSRACYVSITKMAAPMYRVSDPNQSLSNDEVGSSGDAPAEC